MSKHATHGDMVLVMATNGDQVLNSWKKNKEKNKTL
jgi:hypothetical protein